MKYGLKDEILLKIVNIFQSTPEIDEALIFGSRAMGNFKNGSDIDLALKGKLNLEIMNCIRIQLDELLLPYTFDLCSWSQIQNTDLIEHISRHGVVIYAKKKAVPHRSGYYS